MIKIYNYKDYVCSVCFNPLNKCQCQYQPYQLYWIDKPLQDIIKTLNEKGYRTAYSCAGHYIDGNTRTDTYITFAFPYEFMELPQGFQYSKRDKTIRHIYDLTLLDCENFNKVQLEILSNLNTWVKNLREK